MQRKIRKIQATKDFPSTEVVDHSEVGNSTFLFICFSFTQEQRKCRKSVQSVQWLDSLIGHFFKETLLVSVVGKKRDCGQYVSGSRCVISQSSYGLNRGIPLGFWGFSLLLVILLIKKNSTHFIMTRKKLLFCTIEKKEWCD